MKSRIRLIITGSALLSTMGISSVLPVLPSMALAFDMPLATAGLIIAVFAIPGFFLIPFTGVLADRYGRKAILIPSLIIFTLGGLACFFSTSYMSLLIARFVQGIGSASLGTLCSTITADTWEGHDRAKMMGVNGLVLGLGTAFSPALGGIMGLVSWRFPFLLSLIAVPVAWYASKATLMTPQEQVPLESYFKSSWECLKQPATRVLLGLSLLTFIILSGPIVVCFPMFATEAFDASSLQIGLIMAIASFISGFIAVSLTRLYSLYSPRRLLLVSQLLYFISMMTMPLVPGLYWLIVPILFYGAGQGLNIPLVTTLLTGQAPDAQRGALMATNAMAHRFAQGVGPLVFSGFASLMGSGNAIFLGGLVALLMMRLVIKADLPDRAVPTDIPPVTD